MATLGYTWNPPRGIAPVLITTVDCERDRGWFNRLVNQLWVLDYSKNLVGWTRAGSPRAPWRPRTQHIAHLYPPLTPYWEDTTRDADPHLRSAHILFRGGEKAGLHRLIRPPYRYARFHDQGGMLQELLEQTARIGHARAQAGFWQAQALFCRILDLLHRAAHASEESYWLPVSTDAPAPDSFAQQVEEYFRSHLAERIHLAQVARRLHVSLSSLAHRFQEETGESPTRRLISLRVNLAKGLLLAGQRLDAVAAQTGFYDAYHLSKTFKRSVGLSPREFAGTLKRPARS